MLFLGTVQPDDKFAHIYRGRLKPEAGWIEYHPKCLPEELKEHITEFGNIKCYDAADRTRWKRLDRVSERIFGVFDDDMCR